MLCTARDMLALDNRMMRPLDARQVRTRVALRSAILELSEKMPFESITISDIVARANVSTATFYRHYRDKSTLLSEIAHDFTNELSLKITPETVTANSRKAALVLCEFLEEHRGICTALLSHGAKSAIFDDLLKQAVSHSEASGINDDIWLPHSLGPVYMVTTILTLVGWWLHRGEELSSDEMSQLIDRLVFAPVLS